jgi:hypothetical protein
VFQVKLIYLEHLAIYLEHLVVYLEHLVVYLEQTWNRGLKETPNGFSGLENAFQFQKGRELYSGELNPRLCGGKQVISD